MNDETVELIKRAFPQLRNLNGIDLYLYLRNTEHRINQFVEGAEKELNGKKCFDNYADAICLQCKWFFCNDKDMRGGRCCNVKEDNLILTSGGGEWYFCIKECPNFTPQWLHTNIFSCPNDQFHETGYLNIGREQWGYCDACKAKWRVGSNLVSSWRDETEDIWKSNQEKLKDYKEVQAEGIREVTAHGEG